MMSTGSGDEIACSTDRARRSIAGSSAEKRTAATTPSIFMWSADAESSSR
jgi:hypothetical protein